MSNRSIGLTESLHDYLVAVGVREPGHLAELRAEAADHPRGGMQIAPEEGALLSLLVRLTGAERVLEIGTFTGYSSTAMALALPPGGRIVCCDISEEFTARAQEAWRRAGVEERVDLRIGPASDTLVRLEEEGASFDLAFIDADKGGYLGYYEACLGLVRPGGLICVDNVLWSGRVADPAEDDRDTNAIRDFNLALSTDDRIDLAMVPIADGLTLARVR